MPFVPVVVGQILERHPERAIGQFAIAQAKLVRMRFIVHVCWASHQYESGGTKQHFPNAASAPRQDWLMHRLHPRIS